MSRQCTPRSFCSFYAIWLEMSPPCANEPPKKLVKYFSTPYVLYINIYSCSTQSNPSHKMRPYNAASKATNAFSELALCGAYASSYSSPTGQPCDLGTCIGNELGKVAQHLWLLMQNWRRSTWKDGDWTTNYVLSGNLFFFKSFSVNQKRVDQGHGGVFCFGRLRNPSMMDRPRVLN